ncbi:MULTISPECIES: MFS transporter [unclassified Streptomyces]|uniref:MFS transporter n=1 Tax=unclassified Streptomyces TaxID=2593676 RepID=UPI00382CDF0D
MTVLVIFRSGGGRHARVPVRSLLRGIYLPRSADAAAQSMATYAIPLLVLATTGSASLTGLAFTVEWVPRLAAFGLAGSMVDRHGTARVFRLACVLRALLVGAAALVLGRMEGGPAATVTVMLLAAMTGVLTEFSYVAAETAGAVASRDAGDKAHRVQSVLAGIDQSATLVGPALGGFLLEWAGPGGMLTVLGVLSVLGAVLAPRGRRVFVQASAQSASVQLAQSWRAGWTTLRALPALCWMVAGLAVSNLVVGLLQAAAPVIVVQQLGYSTSAVGVVWSAAAVASLLAVTVCRFAIDRFGLWVVGVVSAVIVSAACLAVARAGSYSSYLVLIAVLMVGEGGLTVVLRTVRSRLIPPAVFGSVLSVTIVLLMLPYPVAGVLVALTPPDLLGQVVTVCALLQAVALALTFARLRTDPEVRAMSAPGKG